MKRDDLGVTAIEHNFEVPVEDDPASTPSDASTKGVLARKLNIALLSNTFILALVAISILISAFHFRNVGDDQRVLHYVEARSNNASVHLALSLQDLDANAQNFAAVQSRLAAANSALQLQVDHSVETLPTGVHAQLQGFASDVKALEVRAQTMADSDNPARDAARLRADIQTAFDNISTFALEFDNVVSAHAATLFEDIASYLLVFLIMLVAAIGIALLIARRVVGDVAGMIGSITSSMKRIAGGDNEARIPGRSRTDEIGDMARSLEVFRRSSLELSELTQRRAAEVEVQLAEQQQSSQDMRNHRLEKSHLLEDLAKGFEVSIGELITSVSAASEQLKATSAQMVDVAEGSSDQADSASSAMKSTSHNVTAAAAATDEFALSINEISQQASASATLARDATNLVASANTRMDDLSEAAEEVGEIAGLIQTIAQRTNLLALNASIEAARGGEAGRGFAVVASEVKELAMQTSAATSSVAEKITAMQESTRSSAGDLNSIYDQIGELEKVAVVIATAVDQQSVSGEELARNIDTVAEGSRQVSELLVALREASEETGTAAGDVVESANALGKHAQDLREKAGKFIADVRRSARELEFESEEEGAGFNAGTA